MMWLAATLVTAIQVILVAMTGYLVLLVAASFFYRRPSPTSVTKSSERRFAILVPAHDEEPVIGRLLESLAHLRYPRNLFSVHVVADNCSDGTATVARSWGAHVHERHDPSAPGKGQALRWLLDRLGDEPYDACVIIDADSVVSPSFLQAAALRLEEGNRAVQGYYGVLNPEESWVTTLRALAFTLRHYTRRLGLAALGGSAGLGGNGMVFAADLRQAREWDAFGITEDLELHLKLIESGVSVAFAPEASVLSEMPVSLAQARSQNTRWEKGRLTLTRQYAPRLLASGILMRDWPKVNAAMELIIPPQSVQLLLAAAMLAASFALGLTVPIVLGLAVFAGQLVYVVGGLARARVRPRLWLALAYAPLYVFWKGYVYLRALLARQPLPWVRTPRRQPLTQDDLGAR
jgi:1,2-diacylglycerol 3-beta-glucosyltransferase